MTGDSYRCVVVAVNSLLAIREQHDHAIRGGRAVAWAIEHIPRHCEAV